MAILKSSLKLILMEHARRTLTGPVLALGVPEIYATHGELSRWFATVLQRKIPIEASDAGLTRNDIGKKFGWVDSATFCRIMGWNDVTTVDIPGSEYTPDLVHDLNYPFPPEFKDRFNLVLDPGTLEHVFDVKTALINIVAALRVQGVVIHQVPVYSFNGGYYSINPNVLNDFYRANGFADLATYIIMWDRYHPYTGKHRCYTYATDWLGERHALSDRDQCRFSPHMLFFARKSEDRPTLTIPIQFEGHYGVVNPAHSASGAPRSAVIKIMRRVRSVLIGILPYGLALHLEARGIRLRALIRSRRHSYWL